MPRSNVSKCHDNSLYREGVEPRPTSSSSWLFTTFDLEQCLCVSLIFGALTF